MTLTHADLVAHFSEILARIITSGSWEPLEDPTATFLPPDPLAAEHLLTITCRLRRVAE